MRERIDESDIREFITFLKLRINFSKIYHPEATKRNTKIFQKIVLAYEVLAFINKRRKDVSINKVIGERNDTQLKKIDAVLLKNKRYIKIVPYFMA